MKKLNYLNSQKTVVNFLTFIVAIIVICMVLFYQNANRNRVFINEIGENNITDEEIERLKEFEEKFGEPLFVSYLAYLKDDEFLNGEYSEKFTKKYLIKENENVIELLKGIFEDFEKLETYNETRILSSYINSTSLIFGYTYKFDVESFATMKVTEIYVDDNKYNVVLKSSNNLFYKYSNLSALSDISIGDIILPKKKIGEGEGKVMFSMYVLDDEQEVYINPHNFLKFYKN